MNNVSKHAVVKRVATLLFITMSVGVIAWQDAAAGGKDQISSKSPLGRYLLVASEGLYVVEPDGHASWSYHPAPRGKQVRGLEDDIIYDGWALPNGHFLFSTHRYLREIDRDKHTVWEYRLEAPGEVKSGVPLPNGGVAVLNSQEQAILELEAGTRKVLRRIPVPAQGSDHTRYMLLRRTPEGNYLVALREEKRFVEVTPTGEIVHSISMPEMPIMAQRLSDGSTLGSGFFGLVKLDADWKSTWSFTREDAAPHFPLLKSWGVVEMADHRLVVVNDDWHLEKKGENRVSLFEVDAEKNISWTLPATALQGWKRSEVEPKTGLTENRCVIVQPLDAAVRGE